MYNTNPHPTGDIYRQQNHQLEEVNTYSNNLTANTRLTNDTTKTLNHLTRRVHPPVNLS
jgi:hypothetical protein